MDYNYLFDNEFPQGVKSVYVNGKNILLEFRLKIITKTKNIDI